MPIKIVYYSEVIDNWGRTEGSTNGAIIHSVLMDSGNWSDDMSFEGDDGQVYFIDDLIGKEVCIDEKSHQMPEFGVFTVPTEDE